VESHQLVDYWALVWGYHKRIPWCERIGPKTALILLAPFTYRKIYANVTFFSERIQTMLAGGYEQCLQSRSAVAMKNGLGRWCTLSHARYTPKTEILTSFMVVFNGIKASKDKDK